MKDKEILIDEYIENEIDYWKEKEYEEAYLQKLEVEDFRDEFYNDLKDEFIEDNIDSFNHYIEEAYLDYVDELRTKHS